MSLSSDLSVRRATRCRGSTVLRALREMLLQLPCLLVMAVASVPVESAPTIVSENQLKAVFLFNFSQFVSWPTDAFARPEAPLVIAVLGADPFGEDLDAVVRGEHAGDRALEVRRYRSVADIKDCQILFINRSEVARLPEIVAAVRGRRILTVSDADDAAQRGVIIQFVTENNRIRLRINASAARADGLTISSKLLRPAQIVDAGGA